MSEKQPASNPEIRAHSAELDHQSQENLKRLHKEAEAAQNEAPDIKDLADKAETEAISGKEVTVGERETTQQSPLGTQRELKAEAYKRTLKKVQQDLSKPDRALSKVIHQPQIETISEIAGKTVARPSGILGGGLFALVGSSSLLYLAKHYGFHYNFFVFFLLFVSGYLVGLTVETVVRMFRRHKA